MVCNVNIDAKCGLPVYTQVEVGQAHSCAVVSDGTIRCWGSSAYGRLGPEITDDKFKPFAIPDQTNAAAVATGWGHTCVLARDGKVSCWGANFNGNLGCTDSMLTMTPTRCTPFDAGMGVTQVAAGGEQSCARLATGRIKCWGRNDWGQAGNDSFESQYTPSYVVGISDAIAIAGGTWQTCTVLGNGSVFCFGDNEQGILGAGDQEGDRIGHPVPMFGIDGLKAKAIGVDVSETSSCVVLDDHSLRCSGDNSYGELGDGQTKSSSVPVLAQPSLKAQAVAVGDYVTCALVNSHSVKCWGRGAPYGGLGNGVYANSLDPVDVLLPTDVSFTAVTAKANHFCALSATGRIWCWGDNTFGQLGNDSYVWNSAVPVEVIAPVQ
jgi:alpha-tubulin suppressor-like RCC1 family protein